MGSLSLYTLTLGNWNGQGRRESKKFTSLCKRNAWSLLLVTYRVSQIQTGARYTKFHLDQVIDKDPWPSKLLRKCVLASTSEIKAV